MQCLLLELAVLFQVKISTLAAAILARNYVVCQFNNATFVIIAVLIVEFFQFRVLYRFVTIEFFRDSTLVIAIIIVRWCSILAIDHRIFEDEAIFQVLKLGSNLARIASQVQGLCSMEKPANASRLCLGHVS